jgi:beta-lactamase regulating signal transducer with metallopeptidase domain
MGNDWLAIAWTQAWQVTLLIAVVAIVTRFAAVRWPQLAFVLWTVVFLKCLTPPLWSSPSGAFCRLQAPQARDANPVSSVPPPDLVAPADLVVVSGDALTQRDPVPPAGAAPCRDFSAPDWPCWIAAIWTAGVIAVLAATGWRWQRAMKLCRGAGGEDNSVREIMSRLSQRLGVRRPPRLAVTEGAVGPAVLGLFRPCVLLPRTVFDGKSRDDLELVLAHELVHVRRGDSWFGLLRLLAVALWWFHPLVWWASRQASREAERCCDEAVLAELKCSPARYARCLLDVLDRKREVVYVPACPGVRAMDVTRQRLERIMKIGERGHRRTPWWCWGVAVLAAVVVLPGAAIGLSEDEKRGDPADLPPAAKAAPPRATESGPASSLGAFARIDACSGVSGDPNPETRMTFSYSVEDLLSRIQKEHALSLAESKQFLEQALKSYHFRSEDFRLDWLDDDRLRVDATILGHRRIDQTLEALRKYGTLQATVRASFVTAPVEEIRRVDWTALPSELPASAAANYDGGPYFPGLLDRSFEADAGVRPTRSRRVVEEVSPLLYKVLDGKTERELMTRWQGDKRTNIMQGPKAAWFSGQAGFVSDCTQTPAVVAVKDGRPEIRVLHEGTVAQLRAIIGADGQLKLDFLITLAKVRKIGTAEVSAASNGKPVTIQVPEVETSRWEGELAMPWNTSLLLQGAEVSAGDAKMALCLLIHVEKGDTAH